MPSLKCNGTNGTRPEVLSAKVAHSLDSISFKQNSLCFLCAFSKGTLEFFSAVKTSEKWRLLLITLIKPILTYLT